MVTYWNNSERRFKQHDMCFMQEDATKFGVIIESS